MLYGYITCSLSAPVCQIKTYQNHSSIQLLGIPVPKYTHAINLWWENLVNTMPNSSNKFLTTVPYSNINNYSFSFLYAWFLNIYITTLGKDLIFKSICFAKQIDLKVTIYFIYLDLVHLIG